MRRPYLSKAVLLAGLLWLGVFLAAPPWEQGGPAASSGCRGLVFAAQAWATKTKEAHQPASAEPASPTPPRQNPMSNLIRLLAGGLLAGMLWAALFGYPFYSYWPDRPWPLGLLDLSVAAAFCYLAYLVITSSLRRGWKPPVPPRPAFLRQGGAGPPPATVNPVAEVGMQAIAAGDPDFDLAAFSAHVQQCIMHLHDAWNRQDLDALRDKVGEDLLEYLGMGLRILHLREEISRLEDVELLRLEVTAAGREADREFITLAVEGRVTDYVLQKNSYKLLSGSLTYPAVLREVWRFERRGLREPWKLTDVQDH